MTEAHKPSDLEKYGLGSLSVLIISLSSVWGVVMVKWQRSPYYKYLIACMLGLAVGALMGDAFLHLIPMTLGKHSHDEHKPGHKHDHDEHHANETHHGNETHHDMTTAAMMTPKKAEEEEGDSVWKMLVVLGSLYLFFLIHLLMEYWTEIRPRRKASRTAVGHGNRGFQTDNELDPTAVTNGAVKGTLSAEVVMADQGEADSDQNHNSAGDPLGWMIVMGDATHNFTDGLAIAAAFSINWRSGLSTSIAIFCHEVPQELGDIAAMLSIGWSYKKALLLNFLSSVTAFAGLYIGVPVSNNEHAREWIFAVAAGTFLYISLSNIIPEIISFFKQYSPWRIFLAANGGMLIGLVIMLLIALYEDKIKI